MFLNDHCLTYKNINCKKQTNKDYLLCKKWQKADKRSTKSIARVTIISAPTSHIYNATVQMQIEFK